MHVVQKAECLQGSSLAFGDLSKQIQQSLALSIGGGAGGSTMFFSNELE